LARFKFKFQKVLHARQTVEKEKKKELMQARSLLSALHQEKKQVKQEIINQQQQFSQHRTHEDKANSWRVRQSYLDMLESLKSALGNQIEKQNTEVEKKRTELMESRRERKAMEILREKHYQDYVTSENRKEQIFLNEIGQWQSINRIQNME
jgi:flagellar FliJ protein